MPPIAHAGHWLVQVVYFAPVLGFGAWMGWYLIRERRAAAREEREAARDSAA